MGEITTCFSVGAETVTVVEPATPFRVADTVAVPRAMPVTSPWLPLALLTLAIAVALELQTAVVVTSTLVESLYLAVAVSAWLVPAGRVGFAGASVIETSLAAVTVTVVEALIVPSVACTRLVPIATAVSVPSSPVALLTVATVVVSLDQVTLPVMSTLELSEYLPCAVREAVVPIGSDGFVGEIVIDTNAAAVTVTVAEPLTVPSVALIVALPPLTAVTVPCVPLAFETVATAMLLDCQVTDCVRFAVLLSEYVPVAVSGVVPLIASVLVAGVTAIDVKVSALTVSVVEPEIMPTVAVMVVVPALSVFAE